MALTWLVVLCTSVYGWAALAVLHRRGQLRPGLVTLYAVLLCVFVLDMAIAVAILVHARRRRMIE
jgi:hypothetical protein